MRICLQQPAVLAERRRPGVRPALPPAEGVRGGAPGGEGDSGGDGLRVTRRTCRHPSPTYANDLHGEATGSSGGFEGFSVFILSPCPTHELMTFILNTYKDLKYLNCPMAMRARTIIILEKAELPLCGIQTLRYRHV